ncbi:YybH family protein [Kerstersia sp.]|uniref:YybH family protein n=1 Tax=Kerstersia sp. TaxID=1930783 RepID=UPI003F931A53
MFATPDEAEQAFYKALARQDISGVMQVWADDEEIICISSVGSRIIGQTAVLQAMRELFSRGAVSIRPVRCAATLNMMSAVHVLVEQITERSSAGLKIATRHVTHVFHKGPTGWRLVLHHASPAPDTGGLLPLHEIPDVVH